jgi:PPM family protein phosphatase
VEYSLDRFDATWPFGYDFELSVDANRLSTAVQLANQQVWNHSRQAPECDGMGTTVAAILLGDGCVVMANVGDSRIYQFRGDELKQLSYDDTLVNSMSQQGADPADLANHPMRNVLTQAAGSQEPLEVHVSEQPLASGDVYLICSDGLHGVIGNAAIRSILGSSDNLENVAQRLNQAARGNGGPDNISMVLMSYSC